MSWTAFARVVCLGMLIGNMGCSSEETKPSPTPTATDPPVLISPADSAGLEPLRATLRWHPSPGDVTYDVQVARTITFENPEVVVSALADTMASVGTLQPGQEYFWRVRAQSDEAVGEWSPAWTFTTAGLWEFTPSARFAFALYADTPVYVTGDSLDIKVVAYNLHDVFGAAFQLSYPPDLLEVAEILYNPSVFADPGSYLTIQEIEPDSSRVSIGFTFRRNSGQSVDQSAVILRLRCRALAAGSVHLDLVRETIVITKPDGEPIDSFESLQLDPLDLTFTGR